MLRDLHDDLAEFLRILPNLGELAGFLQHLDKVPLLSVVFFRMFHGMLLVPQEFRGHCRVWVYFAARFKNACESLPRFCEAF